MTNVYHVPNHRFCNDEKLKTDIIYSNWTSLSFSASAERFDIMHESNCIYSCHAV